MKTNLSSNSAELVGNVANFVDDAKQACEPLLDDGAPYSSIGEVELRTLLDELRLRFPKRFDPIPLTWVYFRIFSMELGHMQVSKGKY